MPKYGWVSGFGQSVTYRSFNGVPEKRSSFVQCGTTRCLTLIRFVDNPDSIRTVKWRPLGGNRLCPPWTLDGTSTVESADDRSCGTRSRPITMNVSGAGLTESATAQPEGDQGAALPEMEMLSTQLRSPVLRGVRMVRRRFGCCRY